MHTTIELLLETVFSTRSVQSSYKKDSWGDQVVVGWYLSVESPAVKRKLYTCCSYSETVIISALKSVARVRLVKTEKCSHL
jgi:hypothetical protein